MFIQLAANVQGFAKVGN